LLKFWKRLNELYGWLVILVFGFVLLVGIWQIYDNYYVFHHTLDHSVQKYKPDPTNAAVAAESPITGEMVAWLTMDGTHIDYPVMQGTDNVHFLNTDPFGQYSLTGSVFLDSRSSPDFSDSYSVVYGHHMDYGRMFGALDDYLDESYLKQHTAGTLMLGRNADRVCALEVFASMRVSAKESIVFDMEQDNIRQYIRDHAAVLTVEKEDRILGLSTCTDANSVTRVVVFCYIIE